MNSCIFTNSPYIYDFHIFEENNHYWNGYFQQTSVQIPVGGQNRDIQIPDSGQTDPEQRIRRDKHWTKNPDSGQTTDTLFRKIRTTTRQG